MRGDFSKKEKIIFALVFLLTFFSGIIWLILRHFYFTEYENFGSKILAIHGVCGLILTFIFGIVWTHAKHKLKIKQKKNRKSGLLLLTLFSIIILSGAGLYYIGSESVRNFTSIVHWLLGVISLIGIIIHVPFLSKPQR
jgi:hypothetical protein